MNDLLEQYKWTLELTLSEIKTIEYAENPKTYYEMLRAAQTDLEHAIEWLETGFQPRYKRFSQKPKDKREIPTDRIEVHAKHTDRYRKLETINREKAKRLNSQLKIVKAIEKTIGERDYEILLLYACRVPAAEIAEIFGLSEVRIREIIKESKMLLREKVKIDAIR